MLQMGHRRYGKALGRKLAQKKFHGDTDGIPRTGLPPYDAAAGAVLGETFLSRLAP